ncbi:hypothetical protein MMC22_005711 [Lobaria immixta]|nr:hypothetical protein [Lobaria immixta]
MEPSVITQDHEKSIMDSSTPNSDVKSDDLTVECPTHTTEAALLRKVDFKVLPILIILFSMGFLDRNNLSNALTLGLPQDLKLKGNEVNVAITIFFVPFVIFELPSNLLMKQLKPHIWLSVIVVLFGTISITQGLVTNYNGLLAARFFLGFAESGIYPCCFYLVSMWYKREEAQTRFTLFYSSAVLTAAFGGLLASAIANMDGIRGYSGWRWIFILEGILTCILGVVGFFLVADFPEDVKWLKEDERVFLRERLRIEQGDPQSKKKLHFKDLLFFKDFKFFLGGMMYFGILIPAYGISSSSISSDIFTNLRFSTGLAYFTPTIIKTYGYGPISTQLHSVAPAAVTFVAAVLTAWASDRARHRFLFVVFWLCIGIAGVSVLLQVHHNFHTEYAAIFLVAMSTGSILPVVVCWYTMNLRGHFERSIGTAWVIGFGNIGAIIAAFSFVSSDAPFYHKGYSLAMGGYCLCAVSAGAYFLTIWKTNRSHDLARTHLGTGQDELTENEGLGTKRLIL